MTRAPRPKVPATSPTPNHLPTSFLLLAQYGGRAFIPLDEVCRDFFAHLTPDPRAWLEARLGKLRGFEIVDRG